MSTQRRWALPLVPLYAAGLMVKDGLRAAGVFKVQQLEWPVVSVGSLSAGGAGKTPLVIALAELLRGRGWTTDVLSRGYGRSGGDVELVQPDLGDATERFGDEPVLISRKAGVPVWVGAQRWDAGRALEIAAASEAPTKRLHLLDDGFQHRQLKRKIDIVLMTKAELDDQLLPAGNLREPMSSLRRADVVVVREEEREQVLPRLGALLRAETAIWLLRRKIDFAEREPAGRQLIFCGIARPKDFLRDLRAADASVADAVTFRDHHRYTMNDIERLIAAFDSSAATSFITTEKDAVKLSATMRARLETRGPVIVVHLQVRLLDEDRVMRDIEVRLK